MAVLQGKVILITGASSGLEEAAAAFLAAEEYQLFEQSGDVDIVDIVCVQQCKNFKQ